MPLTSDRKIVLPETSLVIPMTFLSSESPGFSEIPFFFPIFPPVILLISADFRSSSVLVSGNGGGPEVSFSIALRLGAGASESVSDVES